VITNVVTFQVDSRIMQKLVFIVVAIVMALASCTSARKKKRKFRKYMLDILWRRGAIVKRSRHMIGPQVG